jgi:hypothetical protein
MSVLVFTGVFARGSSVAWEADLWLRCSGIEYRKLPSTGTSNWS